jgi:hypothetical protein
MYEKYTCLEENLRIDELSLPLSLPHIFEEE